MVDRVVNKYDNQQYRVDPSRDALEEERNKEGQEEEGNDQEEDRFGDLRDGKDLKQLFDKSHLWQRNIQIKVEDIDKIKILGLNLRTEPSLLKIRIFLFDGSVIPTAFISISRTLGFRIRGLKDTAFVDINMLTRGDSLRVTVPRDEEKVDEEITKVTKTSKELTFSQTFKMLVSKKNWLEKLGLKDPVSKQINNEIVWVYITVVALIGVLGVGILYLLN